MEKAKDANMGIDSKGNEKEPVLDDEMRKKLLAAQRNEITEYFVYEGLARSIVDPHNKGVLERISRDELGHYNFWKKYTKADVKPDKPMLWKYLLISRLFGITFGIKLMERGEVRAQATYEEIAKVIPAAKWHAADEERHEKQIVAMIDEERLRYIGSIVLGLNDALVEFTGALAGFTLALRDPRLIATTGLITGLAASLSMSASEYLSTKTEGGSKDPLRASAYTGSAYVATVLLLILPYLLLTNIYLALGITIFNAMALILFFTFYVSVAKDIPFKKRFLEMATISLGIAALSFALGFFVRELFGLG